MKRLGLLALTGAMVLVLQAHALAIPEFKKQWDAHYAEKSDNAEFKTAVTEAKCNVCHFGKSKKNRNDYGEALHKFLEKDNYKPSRVRAEPEKVLAEILEAFKKVEEMKGTDGATFGSKLQSGSLPGIAPEGDDAE